MIPDRSRRLYDDAESQPPPSGLIFLQAAPFIQMQDLFRLLVV